MLVSAREIHMLGTWTNNCPITAWRQRDKLPKIRDGFYLAI